MVRPESSIEPAGGSPGATRPLPLGFGLEQLATDEDRVEVLRKALNGLLG